MIGDATLLRSVAARWLRSVRYAMLAHGGERASSVRASSVRLKPRLRDLRYASATKSACADCIESPPTTRIVGGRSLQPATAGFVADRRKALQARF